MNYNELRKTIAKGKTIEVIELLLESLDNCSEKNELILLSSRYNDMAQNTSVLHTSEKQLEFASITQSLLSILDRLEKEIKETSNLHNSKGSSETSNKNTGNSISFDGAKLEAKGKITVIGGDSLNINN